MQLFKRHIALWAILVLGTQTMAQAQMVKFIMKSRVDCDSLFHIELYVKASALSTSFGFGMGSSSVLLNYDANSFAFDSYTPIEFDKTTSTRAATANWDNQNWTSNQNNGIFNLVLFKKEGGTNDYLLDTVTEIPIGNLYFKVKKNAPTTASTLSVNRNYTSFLLRGDETKLALEQLTSLSLTPKNLNVPQPIAVITGASRVCVGQTTLLTASGGTTYKWSNAATGAGIRVGAGTYTVTVSNSVGCSSTKTATLASDTLPIVAVAGATSVCTDQTTVLTASGGVTYKWSNAATTADVTVGAGAYTVTATNAAGCNASKYVSVSTSTLTAIISGTTTVCGTATTNLWAGGGSTYKWSNGVTTSANTVSAGTYTVTATNTIGCTSTKTVTVLSNPLPVITIAGASSVCVGEKTILTASGGATYRWNNGITTPSVSVGSGTYTVTATSNLACSATKSVTLTSDTLPRVAIAGATSVCTDKTSVLTATGGTTYAWSNGASTPSVTVGAGTYTVTATNAAACTASKSITISTSVVTATITGNATVCGTATTGLSAGGGSSYVWSNGATSSWIAVSAGTYTVTATNNIGCTGTKTTTITSNPVPVVAIAGATSVCTGQNTALTASGGDTYKWNNAETTAAITVGAGSYTVTATNTVGCSASKSITVSTSIPTATISGNTTVCGTATTSLTAYGGTTYKWSNDSTTATINVSAGTYTVTATNTIGCTATKTVTVLSNPLPVVSIAGASSVCVGQKTTLTASGGTTYKWNNGATTPSVSVSSGTYTVTVTNDLACKATKSVTLTSDTLPRVAIAGATSVCTDKTSSLTASGGITYAWSNGETAPSVNVGAGTYSVTATNAAGCNASKSITISTSVVTATITGNATVCGTANTGLSAGGGNSYIWSNGATTSWISVSAGTYTVTATNNIGCTGTKTTTITSNPVPVVAIAGATSVCTGQNTVLTASGGDTYKWNNAETTAAITVGAGSYTVTATNTVGCSASKSITVSTSIPTATISGNTTVCGTATTSLTAYGGTTYKWSNDTITARNTVSAGTYTVTVTNTIGCTATKTVTVLSNPLPVIAIAGANSVCVGEKTILTASGGATYRWNNGITTPSVSVGSGTYTVTATSDLACSATKTVTLASNPLPVVAIAGATSVCTGKTTVLTASGGATYTWSNGATTPSVTVGAGTYSVTATSAFGCIASKSITISTSVVTATISGNTSVCGSGLMGLLAGGGSSYAWSNGATASWISVPAGTYTVTATNSLGCSATQTTTITSNPVPVVAITGATSVCTGQTTVLTASGGGTYKWNNAETTAAITVGAGSYVVTATSAAGCTASKSITVSTSIPTATISGNTTVCGTATTSLTAYGGTTYKWSNDTITARNTVSAGTYTVTVINTIGCTATKTVTVLSNPLPVIAIAGASSVCVGQKTVLEASGGTTYRWSNGITTPSVSLSSGTYSVYVTSDLGCSATKSVTLASDTLPRVAIAGATSVCTDKTSSLTASGGIKYAWSNGETTPSVNVGAGTYSVTATNAAGCNASKSITISTSVVTPTITGNATVCGSGTTGLSAGGGSSYTWSNGATSSWISASAGTYTVTATNNIGCTATKTATITSNPVPVVAIAGATSVCGSATTTLTASGGGTYKWSNDATTAAITVGAGIYAVTVTSTAGCTATKYITVSSSTVTATITGNTAVCGSATTSLQSAGGSTYKWSNGATTSSITVGVGTYTVTATNSIGCTGAQTVTIGSNPIPVVAISGPSSICSGSTTALTASGGATYKWSNAATSATITVGAGIYAVTATSTAGCTASKSITLSSTSQPAGTTCNDGNANTINDVIQADGCTCKGTPLTSQSLLAASGSNSPISSDKKLAIGYETMSNGIKNAPFIADFHIFPNPVTDFMNVDLKHYEGKSVTLQVYNIFGKLIQVQQIEKATTAPVFLELNTPTNGQYLLRVTTQGQKDAVKTFVISH